MARVIVIYSGDEVDVRARANYAEAVVKKDDWSVQAPSPIVVKTEGGTNDYNKLVNRPSIEGVELVGNKTYPELNLDKIPKGTIDTLVSGIFG